MTETLNKALKIAVETNNLPFLEWVFTQGLPTNLSECLLLATEKGQMEQIALLTKKLPPAPTATIVKRSMTLHVPRCSIDYKYTYKPCETMTELMDDLHTCKAKAAKDLEEGKISKEEINHQMEQDGYTALHYVCHNVLWFDAPETMVQMLVDQGADVNLLNTCGSTAFNCLSRISSCEKVYAVAKILLKVPGINLNMTNDSNSNAMDYVTSCFGDGKLFELLLNTPEYDINYQDQRGATNLISLCAVSIGSSNFIKIVTGFLNHPKVDVNVQNNEGETALMKVCGSGVNNLQEIAKLFLNHPKIDLKLKNKKGQTAFDILCPNYDFAMCFLAQMNGHQTPEVSS